MYMKRIKRLMNKKIDLDKRAKARLLMQQQKSDQALKYVIIAWILLVILLLLHIASVINQGYAISSKKPVPEHYFIQLLGPAWPIVVNIFNTITENIQAFKESIDNLISTMYYKLFDV